jgi:hypothetical protein
MITRPLAVQLVKKLAGLPGFPKEDDTIEVLVDALETAPTAGAARTFITSWMFDEVTAPTPAHIYRYFHPSKSTEQATTGPLPTSRNCPLCNGTGWEIVQGANLTTAAKPCSCRQMSLVLSGE